jgi:glycosyltransferase involved in cell wall biosynthesis
MGERPHVLLLNWRDTGHPEGGGSERYLERMARGLVARGYRVTIQCAAYPGAPADEWRDGVLFRRRGTRFTVYPRALAAVVRLRPDVVVDVQNGIPFFSRLVARCPVLVLVHHVHREQWRPAVGRVLGRIGWWIESRLAPRFYRKCPYLTVSEITRDELGTLGIEPRRVTVIRPGLEPAPPTFAEPDDDGPVLVVVGRLVPHKQIEHAIDALARLTERWPKLRLEVVGRGWWRENLVARARVHGVEDRVTFHGFVDEQDKHEILARSAVHLCPSVKEGWGIAIMEAAAHGVPSVAYLTAGGVNESIVDNETGLLAHDFEDLVRQVDLLLHSPAKREAMGEAGRRRAALFGWERGVEAFERALGTVTAGRSRQRRPTDWASAPGRG